MFNVQVSVEFFESILKLDENINMSKILKLGILCLVGLMLLLSRSVVSNSVRPQRRQPTRFPRPWDSPGKNTGVGCHFLLQCMKVKSERKSLSHVLLLATPWTAAYQAPPSTEFSRQKYWSGVSLPSPWTRLSTC